MCTPNELLLTANLFSLFLEFIWKAGCVQKDSQLPLHLHQYADPKAFLSFMGGRCLKRKICDVPGLQSWPQENITGESLAEGVSGLSGMVGCGYVPHLHLLVMAWWR